MFVFLIDYIEHPVHTWTLLFAYLAYGGFGLAAAIGLWFRKTWGNWTYYLHVLSGTINFSYAVIPFTPGFENDYLYLGWIVGGNIAACLAVMWTGQKHFPHESPLGVTTPEPDPAGPWPLTPLPYQRQSTGASSLHRLR